MASEQEIFLEARDLIQQGQYARAKQVLRQLPPSPQAQSWLSRIEELEHPNSPPPYPQNPPDPYGGHMPPHGQNAEQLREFGAKAGQAGVAAAHQVRQVAGEFAKNEKTQKAFRNVVFTSGGSLMRFPLLNVYRWLIMIFAMFLLVGGCFLSVYLSRSTTYEYVNGEYQQGHDFDPMNVVMTFCPIASSVFFMLIAAELIKLGLLIEDHLYRGLFDRETGEKPAHLP